MEREMLDRERLITRGQQTTCQVEAGLQRKEPREEKGKDRKTAGQENAEKNRVGKQQFQGPQRVSWLTVMTVGSSLGKGETDGGKGGQARRPGKILGAADSELRRIPLFPQREMQHFKGR
ncbi:hypothetical protein P7K49_012855, partial [Saguinus oedipus]